MNADTLKSVIGGNVYPASITERDDVTYFLVRAGIEKHLCAFYDQPALIHLGSAFGKS